ncbi:MAG TPA: ATP-binding protein [Blastocatellia bacterium]|nr:ATP-binding protein [Blastocatellia bacterium]
MILKDFISEALCEPTDFKGYNISRKLSELYKNRAIVEGESYSFNLAAYEKAGQCSIVNESSVHNQVTTGWEGVGKKLSLERENTWLNVLWRGELLDVVFVSWYEGSCKTRYHWIIADTETIAKDFFQAVCDWDAEVRGEILVYEDSYWNKNEELFAAIKRATLDNLILSPNLKEEIKSDFERFFASRELYEKYGIPWKRGVLLIGPPGNGKTHTVKALINHLKQPCLYVKNFYSSYGAEYSMKRLFQRARQTTPCIVVMEDMDSLVDGRNRSYFLNEMDGFAANTGVVVLATTNHPEKLDPAILDRPSRFDRKYYFNLPAADERASYLSTWNNSLQKDLQLSAKGIAKVTGKTEGFSFAYLKELMLSSMMEWMSSSNPIAMDKVAAKRAAILREQMSKAAKSKDDSAKK